MLLSDRSLSGRFAAICVSWRWPLFALSLVLAGIAYPVSTRIAFDHSIENIFTAEDPVLPPYQRLKARFGGNEIVIAVYRDRNLMHPDGAGIQRIGRIGAAIEKLPGVRSVMSLAKIDQLLTRLENPLGFGRSAENQETDGTTIIDQENASAVAFLELFEGYTHSADREIAAIVCLLETDPLGTVSPRQTVTEMRAILAALPEELELAALVGEPVMVADGFRLVRQDGTRLSTISTGLLGITIWICFRSLRWVIIPLVVVRLAIWLTQAVLVWSGLQLSMVSSMLSAIITVIGVATVMHILVRFQTALRDGLSPLAAMTRTLTLLAAPIFWTCATDAIGFAALLYADVRPVRDFGLMMAIGSLSVLVSVVMAVPALSLGASHIDPLPARPWGERSFDLWLSQLIRSIERRPRGAALLGLLGLFTAFAGLTKLDVETNFMTNFRAQSPISRSYQLVEERLGGAGVWDIVVPAPKVLDQAFVDQILAFEQRLKLISQADLGGTDERPALRKVLSFADILKTAEANRLISIMPIEFRAQALDKMLPTFVQALHARDPDGDGQNYFRIMLRASERQPADQKMRLIRAVENECFKWFPPQSKSPAIEISGFFLLLTNLIKSLLQDQWLCFSAASVGIGLAMLLAFRNVLLVVLAMVPNVLPIVCVLGAMGWIGLKINMGVAIIVTVSIGLSVDSAIHYIISFRRSLALGKDVPTAVYQVQQTVGRAAMFSTLALTVGFTVLCTSDFVPTIYFGALASLSMLGGLVGNLVILPLFLKGLYGRRGPAVEHRNAVL
ncbi:MAG: MMPL family transporter [Pirellulaceae bacterium]|nr:MMPL family transporter [Pirellulaceae bacterium]